MKTKSLITILFLLTCFYVNAQIYHINEDFNAGGLPTGWTNTAVTGTATWSFGLDGSADHSGNNNLDGTSFAYFDDSNLGSSSTNNRAALVTPAFNNAASAATFLEFDYNFRQFGAHVPDSFYVEVFDGTSWNVVFSRSFDDCGNYLATACNNFPHASINISVYKNTACQIRFVYYDGNDWSWYAGLDNVAITSPIADDIGVTALLSPQSDCGLTANELIKVRIFNYGGNTASGFSASYRINGGAPVTEIISTSILGGDSLDYTFVTTANLSTLGSYLIESYTDYSLDGSNTNDSLKTTVNNNPIYQPSYFEGFDAGLGGWQISGMNPSWAVGIPAGTRISTSAGGSGSLVTNLSGFYNDNEISYVTSPCLDFSTLTIDPSISFSLYHDMENPFDEFWVEFSTDNGATWAKIPASTNSINWYTNTTTNVWSGSNSGWAKSESTMVGTAGQSKVNVRFVFSSDGSVNIEGVGIDNFTIKGQLPIDLEMLSLDGPVPSNVCGLGSSEIITVTLVNKGTTPITTFNAGYRVNGGTAVFQNNITPSTPIAPNTTYQFSFTQTANMMATADYFVDVWANTVGDSFLPNDSLFNTLLSNTARIVLPKPYKEDFNGFTVGTIHSNANDSISDEWMRYSSSTGSSDYLWRVGEGTINRSGATGPAADVSGNGYFMYTEASSGSSGDTAFLESPCLDLSTVNGATLSFWWHRYGSQIGNMYLDIYDGTQWVNAVVTLSTTPQTSSTDAWIEEIVNLSAYTGRRIKIRFRAVSLGCCAGDMAIDELLIFESIPQDAKLDAILSPTEGCGFTANSTVIAAVENFGTTTIAADSLYMYYQVDNLPPVKDTVNVSIPVAAIINHTFTIGPDLSTIGQTYNLKVWTDLNGDSNIGNDTAYLTVTNNVKTLPFSEDFQSFGTQSSTTGWTFDPSTTSGIYWRSNTGGTSSSNTGPNGDHTTGNGRYVYLETSSNGGPGYLVSPCIDLTNVSGAVLNFWYHKYGAGMNDLFVDVFDNSLGIWVNNIGVIHGQSHTSPVDPWKEIYIGLSQFAGKQIKVRFRGLDDVSGFTGDMAIDDVLIFESIPQDAKLDFLLTPDEGCGHTSNTPVVAVIENFGLTSIAADSLYVYYQVDNLPPIKDTVHKAIPVDSAINYTFNNGADLSINGIYNIKVWTELSGDSNNFNDTIFNKINNRIIPFIENFDSLSNQYKLNGWIHSYDYQSVYWKLGQGQTPSSNTGPSSDHTLNSIQGKYFFYESSNVGDSAILESPCIDLPSGNSSELTFWYYMYGDSIGALEVQVFDGVKWNKVDSIIGQQQLNMYSPWIQRRISLIKYLGKEIKVRFIGKANGIWRGDIAIDDFEIKQSSRIAEIDLLRENNSCNDSLNVQITYTDTSLLDLSVDSMTVWVNVYGQVNLRDSLILNSGINSFGDTIKLNFGALNQNVSGMYNYDLVMVFRGDTIRKVTSINIEKPKIENLIKGEVCLGQTIQLSSINYNSNINWQTINGGAWQNIVGQNNSVLAVSPIDTTGYRIAVCNSNFSDSLQIDVFPFSFNVQGDSINISCGDSANFKIYNATTGARTNYWYQTPASNNPIFIGDTFKIITGVINNGMAYSASVFLESSTRGIIESIGDSIFDFTGGWGGSSTNTQLWGVSYNSAFLKVNKRTRLNSFDMYFEDFINYPLLNDTVEIVVEDLSLNKLFEGKVKVNIAPPFSSPIKTAISIGIELDTGMYRIRCTSLDSNLIVVHNKYSFYRDYSVDSSVIHMRDTTNIWNNPGEDFFANINIGGGGCRSIRIPVPYYADCLVGIYEKVNTNTISIYPNPSSGIFSIKSNLKSQRSYLLQVRDIKGQLIYNNEVNNLSDFMLDLSGQSKGLYFLQIRSEEGILNEKIVIQ